MQHNNKKIKYGFIWSAIDSFGVQITNLVISLILANKLGPEAYGLIAMMAIFIAIAGVFVNSGFGSALIRKLDRTEKDLATTFYFSLLVSLACYGILFIFSSHIAKFYNQPELELLTKVIALTLIINSLTVIPKTKLTIELNFKKQALVNLTSTITGGGVGLIMAFKGYGVWSLVIQQITFSVVGAFLFSLVCPWRPKEPFCKKSFSELFGFGSKLLASGLLDAVYNNLYGLVIGKQFSASQLGIYNQANVLSTVPATSITNVIQKVTYPMLSQMQKDTGKLDVAYLNILKLVSMIVFPLLFGLCIVAEPFISILLGKAWQESASLVSVLSIGMAVYPIHAVNLNMLQVKGRSDLFLKLEVIKKALVTIALFITVPMGVMEMCIGVVVTSYLSLVVNTYYTGKLSSISQVKQLKALAPIGIITVISSLIGYYLGSGEEGDFWRLFSTLSSAFIVYFSLMFIFQKKLLKTAKKLIF